MTGFYRALLRLYPTSYREQYGDELADAFAWRTVGAGPLRAVLLAIADVVPAACAVQWEILARDVKHAFRVFARSWGFYGGLICVLALGAGANAGVFSVLQAVLLRPLPYRDPGNLLMVWTVEPVPDDPLLTRDDRFAFSHRGLTREQIDVLRAESVGVLSDLASVRTWQTSLDAQFDLSLPDRSERLRGAWVSPNFFDVLGPRLAMGRAFTQADDPNGPAVAVISHGLWERAFGLDPQVVGRSLTVSGGRAPRGPRTFQIVGVLAPGSRFTHPDETEVWVRESWADVDRYPGNNLAFYAVARIAASLSRDAANARLASIRNSFERPGERQRGLHVAHVEPMREWVVGNAREPVLLLGALSLILLVIACVTVAGGLLVRAASRSREMAVRASLGAHPARLRRELFTQGICLAAAGTAGGCGLAAIAGPLLRGLLPLSFPRGGEAGLSVWIVAFALATTALATVLAAFAPAVLVARRPFVIALRQASAAASPDPMTGRWRAMFVGTQSAITTALLVSAALLSMSLWRLSRVPLGFDASEVLTLEMRAIDPQFREQAALLDLQERVTAAVRDVPGVAEVGQTSAVPFRGVDFMTSVTRLDSAGKVAPNKRYVDSAFFDVMRMPVMYGRNFNSSDRPGSEPVAVVSESFARQMFGRVDVVGELFDPEKPKRIAGVVRDVRYVGFEREPRPAIYLPRSQLGEAMLCLVVRLRPGFGDALPAVRAALHRAAPAVPLLRVRTVGQILDDSISGRRFYTVAAIVFASIALALTLVGLGVVVARGVIERAREFAVRAALGAEPVQLVSHAVAAGMKPVALGIAAGLLGVWLGRTALAAFVFGVGASSPLVFGSVAAAVALLSIGASLIPARRAALLSPADALRSD